MPSLNYAKSYQQALAQAYAYVLHFAALRSTENNSRFKWTGAKTIEIATLSTSGRTDGDRDSIAEAKRNFDNNWETKTLTNYRKWSTLVDPKDIDETNQVASIQNITRTFNETQKFPEMDAYLVSKLFNDWQTAGGAANTTAPTVDNFLSLIDAAMEAMDEANVPLIGRIMYITPAMNTILKNAKDLARRTMNGDSNIVRMISAIDDLKIEKVPSTLMKTVYDFTEGWKPGTGAKQINFLIAHPSAVITPEKYNFVSLDEPSAKTDGKWYYYEESYNDVFLLNERKKAV